MLIIDVILTSQQAHDDHVKATIEAALTQRFGLIRALEDTIRLHDTTLSWSNAQDDVFFSLEELRMQIEALLHETLPHTVTASERFCVVVSGSVDSMELCAQDFRWPALLHSDMIMLHQNTLKLP